MEHFRNFEKKDNKDVIECYKKQRTYQTVDYVLKMRNKYCLFDNTSSFWELFDMLKDFVDLSDPDISLPNHQHLFQTAEGLRKDGYPDWMQLTGLIHDLGKILYKKGCDQDGTSMKEQWGIVGDTYVVGCKIPDTIVYPEFNSLNPDMSRVEYGSTLGIYQTGIGLDNMLFSFGHDEYLYQLLKHNNVQLPKVAMHIIRYHSCYLWHKEGEYIEFENEDDKKYKEKVILFNKYDLYTKENKIYDYNEMKKYYDPIVKKYFKDIIYW